MTRTSRAMLQLRAVTDARIDAELQRLREENARLKMILGWSKPKPAVKNATAAA